MKSITCKELGGACNQVFSGDSFEDLVEQSKQQGMEMFQKGSGIFRSYSTCATSQVRYRSQDKMVQ